MSRVFPAISFPPERALAPALRQLVLQYQLALTRWPTLPASWPLVLWWCRLGLLPGWLPTPVRAPAEPGCRPSAMNHRHDP